MKNYFCFFAIFCFSLSLSVVAHGQNQSNYADAVKALFDKGSFPHNIKPGAWSGICYSSNTLASDYLTTGQGAFISVVEKNEGPLFPPDQKIGFDLRSAPGWRFDYPWSSSDISSPNETPLASIYDGSFAIFLDWQCQENHSSDAKVFSTRVGYLLRSNGDYLVIKIQFMDNVPVWNAKAGDGFLYCYFFNRVQ